MGLAERFRSRIRRGKTRPDPQLCPAGLHPWQPPFKQTPEGATCLECDRIYLRMWARYYKRKGVN